MKKKAVGLLLIGAMAASLLAGCGGGDGDKKSGNSSADSTETGTQSGVEIDMDEEPYECAIQVVILPGADFSSQEAEMEEALDKLTLPAINTKVDIQFTSIAEVAKKTSLGVAGGEKLDLVHVATVSPLSSMVGQDLLIDMNEDNLLQERGKDILALYEDKIISAGNVDGQQLAIPAKQFNASAKGVYYNKTFADEHNITVPKKGTLEDLGMVLGQVKSSGQDIMPFYVGVGTNNYLYWLEAYNTFGNLSSYGVIFNETAGNTKIENVYASDKFKKFADTMKVWREDGIIQKNQEDQSSAQDYYGSQELFCVVSDISPALEAQYKAKSKSAGFETEFMTIVDPAVTNSVVQEYMWGIAANSERPEKAMDLLNYLYKDANAANILLYGLEGKNYEKVAGTQNVIETNGSYIAPFMVIGDNKKVAVQAPNTDDYVQQNEELIKNSEVSPLIGYMYTAADFQAESGAIDSVIAEYLPYIQNGVYPAGYDLDKYLAEFNEKLDQAGINDIIADNQEKLDAFLAEK